MRTWHRWTMTLALPLLAYWVLSGLWLAFYDATDTRQVWAREGGGPGARIDGDAVDARPLSDSASLAAGLERARAVVGNFEVASVELRSIGGTPVVQLADESGDRARVVRLDASTGLHWDAPVEVDDRDADPDGSIRQRNSYKSWHRGDIAGLPGQIIGLITGVALLALCTTGLLLYRSLWPRRRAAGKPALLWRGGESAWRRIHRWVSLCSAVFILNIAITGVTLAAAEIQLNVFLHHHIGTPPYPRPTAMPPVSQGALPGDLGAMLKTAFNAARQRSPDAEIAIIRLVVHEGVPKALVTYAGRQPVTVAFDPLRGTPVDDYATSGRQHGQGYFADWHQVVKRMHRGDILGGFSGRYVDIAAGFAIAWLVLSAIAMYVELLRRRVTAGRRGLFWR